jgi:hypothetical protein
VAHTEVSGVARLAASDKQPHSTWRAGSSRASHQTMCRICRSARPRTRRSGGHSGRVGSCPMSRPGLTARRQ